MPEYYKKQFEHIEAINGALNELDPASSVSSENARTALKELKDSLNLKGAAEQFRTEWYKATRAHELELNKATLAYEHERLKFLSYVNGGAAGAYVSVLTAKDSILGDSVLATVTAIGAVGVWLLGLYFAWGAWRHGHEGQRSVTSAFRTRRQIEERQQLDDASESLNRYGIPCAHDDEESSETAVALEILGLFKKAHKETRKKTTKFNKAWEFANYSVVCFGAGALVAAMPLLVRALPVDKEMTLNVTFPDKGQAKMNMTAADFRRIFISRPAPAK